MCGFIATSRGDLAESVCDCFHFHCQAGGLDCIGRIVFVDGGHTLLDSEASP